MKLSTLTVFAAVAIATVSASPTLELRGARPNGVSCRHDATCASSYCHHSKCDVKKKDGHACYKAAGCVSGECNDGKCGKKAHPHPHPHPSPPSDHPHPVPGPGPQPGPPGPGPQPGPPGPTGPPSSTSPSSGSLSFVGTDAQLLGEIGQAYDDVEALGAVQEAQTWTVNSAGNLQAPSGKILITDGYFIGDAASSYQGQETVPYVCSAAQDSSATQRVLDCAAPVASGDGSSFILCQDEDSDASYVQTGAAPCSNPISAFNQLTLSTSK